MSKLRVHIGHHFYGAGNLGDDLMLDGFLVATRQGFLDQVTITCCTSHDRACQRLRFPEIEWLPYEEAIRSSCIRNCDVWLGLGDTPFQATGGHTWFLDHLCQEAEWCRQAGVPMYYLGVGVNEREVVDLPQLRLLVEQAETIWVRDDLSAEMLAGLARPGQIVVCGDLAHLALETMNFPPPESNELGFVLNFEDPRQYRVDRLAYVVERARPRRVRWLAQEVRPLPGSETVLHSLLPPAARKLAPLTKPDYAGATTARALLDSWQGLETLFVTRYHAALIGAWIGARIVIFARNDKVAGAARQLGLAPLGGVSDADFVLQAVREAQRVEREVLREISARIRGACGSFFCAASGIPRSRKSSEGEVMRPYDRTSATEKHQPRQHSMRRSPAKRLLLLRPDAYGDLILFEPVPRIIRHYWPQTEIAVLIRQRYADAIPLLACEGVKYLSTTCDPYRELPDASPAAYAALRQTVCEFEPDCIVAACSEQTWLEATVGAFLPGVRQVSFGPELSDPLSRAALEKMQLMDWDAIYPERMLIDREHSEWEKNLRIAGELLEEEAPRWWPLAHVPESARARTTQLIAERRLTAGQYVACAAAGTANVKTKSWSAESYGQILSFLEHDRGISALLIGHESERERLESVQAEARRRGANPALWTGQDGEMPVVAGILDSSRFYLGNDTGALHLAAALGRPVVSIFGGGHWPRFRPVAARELTFVQPLPCFGCGWECDFADAPCVKTISAETVQTHLGKFLDADCRESLVIETDDIDAMARAIIGAATPRLRFLREDGRARLQQVEALAHRLDEAEADRAQRLLANEKLGAQLAASEADRSARLRQVEQLTAQLIESEADRANRLAQVEQLTALLHTSEADRAERLRHMERLTEMVHAAQGAAVAEKVSLDNG